MANGKVYLAMALLFIGSVFGGAGGAQVLTALNAPATFDQLERSVVRVQYDESYGSGVLVAPDKVLTAKHVVDSKKDGVPVIVFANGTTVKVKSIERNPDLDLAEITLETPMPAGLVARYSCDLPENNTTLLGIGSPLDIAFGAFRFNVAGTMRDARLPKGHIVLQGPSNPGLSGGPAFNEQGQAVGLINYHIRGSQENPETGLGLMLPFAAFCEEGKPWFGSAS